MSVSRVHIPPLTTNQEKRIVTMKTHFAPAERSDAARLKEELDFVKGSSIVTGLLNSVSGLLAVLNEHRQILAINESLLEMLGVGSAEYLLGLRLGEVIHCIHSSDMPGGCGTSEFCSTCGAAIAMVTCSVTEAPVEKTCAVTIENNDRTQDLYLRVRSVPVAHQGKKLILLFMQDITHQQRLASLEQVFFHDINGILQGILGAGELISVKAPENIRHYSNILRKLTLRLVGEVAVQQCLSQNGSASYQQNVGTVRLHQIVEDVGTIISGHPAKRGRTLVLPETIPDVTLTTDAGLVVRILVNMVVNALEATDEGDAVKMSVDSTDREIVFSVWNRKPIPHDIARRIFQRNFSTKAETGRGLGTYSMKLFGEEILGGKVGFLTSVEDGTCFHFRLPVR
jgi:signal transduction histidine kinase